MFGPLHVNRLPSGVGGKDDFCENSRFRYKIPFFLCVLVETGLGRSLGLLRYDRQYLLKCNSAGIYTLLDPQWLILPPDSKIVHRDPR